MRLTSGLLLGRQFCFDLYQTCFERSEFCLSAFEDRGLHVKILPRHKIELGELRLQYGFEVAFHIAAESPQRLGDRFRQTARQIVQIVRVHSSSPFAAHLGNAAHGLWCAIEVRMGGLAERKFLILHPPAMARNLHYLS
jgi:hypothetical protein